MTPTRKYIGQTLTIHIDRPLGSCHPEHGFFYSLNYGYLPGVMSGDGEELDAYVLGIFETLDTFTGVCIAVIHRLEDDDDKLILVPEGRIFTEDQIRALTEFNENGVPSEVYFD